MRERGEFRLDTVVMFYFGTVVHTVVHTVVLTLFDTEVSHDEDHGVPTEHVVPAVDVFAVDTEAAA